MPTKPAKRGTATVRPAPGRYLAVTLEDRSLRSVLAEVDGSREAEVEILSDNMVPLSDQAIEKVELAPIAAIVRRQLHGIIPADLREVRGIGISSPGTIDTIGKRLIDIPRRKWRRGEEAGDKIASVPTLVFADLFEPGYLGRIVADNDTMMSALGERWQLELDSGQPVADFCLCARWHWHQRGRFCKWPALAWSAPS